MISSLSEYRLNRWSFQLTGYIVFFQSDGTNLHRRSVYMKGTLNVCIAVTIAKIVPATEENPSRQAFLLEKTL
jgi:hypothetical protein